MAYIRSVDLPSMLEHCSQLTWPYLLRYVHTLRFRRCSYNQWYQPLQAVEPCSRNFPIRNYTLVVVNSAGDNTRIPVILAIPTPARLMGTLFSSDIPLLVRRATFQVSVEVCNDLTCARSISIPLSECEVDIM